MREIFHQQSVPVFLWLTEDARKSPALKSSFHAVKGAAFCVVAKGLPIAYTHNGIPRSHPAEEWAEIAATEILNKGLETLPMETVAELLRVGLPMQRGPEGEAYFKKNLSGFETFNVDLLLVQNLGEIEDDVKDGARQDQDLRVPELT